MRRLTIVFAALACMTVVTVASRSADVASASTAASEEYVLSPAVVNRHELPNASGSQPDEEAIGSGVLASGAPPRDPLAAASDASGQLPAGLVVATLASLACLVTGFAVGRRDRETEG